jgi:hypothetical protein
MENVPVYISVVFGLSTAGAVGAWYRASNRSGRTLGLLLLWLLVQAAIASTGFYTVTDGVPPRFLLLVAPPMLTIIALFATTRGQAYLAGLRMETLLLLHVVRIPVELVLYWLFLHRAVPQLMTFEGRNWDIISGVSALVIYCLLKMRRSVSTNLLLLWNVGGLALLLNIVVNAVLSAPSPFQQFAFTQPNVAILHFPFVWLPSCVVPLVLLAHMAAIRQLLAKTRALNKRVLSVSPAVANSEAAT